MTYDYDENVINNLKNNFKKFCLHVYITRDHECLDGFWHTSVIFCLKEGWNTTQLCRNNVINILRVAVCYNTYIVTCNCVI